MPIYRYANRTAASLAGSGAGINPSRGYWLSGLGNADVDSLFLDQMDGSDDGSVVYATGGPTAQPVVYAGGPAMQPTSNPFDLANGAQQIFSWIYGGLTAGNAAQQQAALLAAQNAQAERGSNVGLYIGLGIAALAVGSVLFAAIKS